MSIALVTQVMRMRMKNQTEKLILLAFAEHSGDDDLSYPSVDLVAAEALCSGRTVQRVIKQFIDDGLLKVGRRASGRGYPTGYRVCPEALGPIPEYRELREAQRSDSHPPAGSRNPDPGGDLQRSLLPVDNTQRGDTQMSPIPPVDSFQKGDRSGEKGDKSGLKGDTQTSPEPRTFNHKETASAVPVDNSRAAGARESSDRCHPSRHEGQHSKRNRLPGRKHPDHYNPDEYRESLEKITELARTHALPPRQKWENEFAFRNRVKCGAAALCVLKQDCRRLNISGRQPGESLEDFEFRVSKADLQQRGLASSLTSSEARAQALSITDPGG